MLKACYVHNLKHSRRVKENSLIYAAFSFFQYYSYNLWHIYSKSNISPPPHPLLLDNLTNFVVITPLYKSSSHKFVRAKVLIGMNL